MGKLILDEYEVRNALASIVGTEPNGIFLTAIENRSSDAAVAAAFGAIGMAIAQSGRPRFHIIHPTATGFYFIPVYVKKKQYILAPQQNFFIPHEEFAQFTIVKALIGGGFTINIKLRNGKKLSFSGNRKVKYAPFQEEYFPYFYEPFIEQSKKAQTKNYIMFAVLAFIVVAAVIGFAVLLASEEPAVDENGNYYTQTQSIEDVLTLEVPTSFIAYTETELKEQNAGDNEVIALFEHPSGTAAVSVIRSEAEITHDEMIEMNSDNPEYEIVEINGVKMLKTQGIETDSSYTYNTVCQSFIADGNVYVVVYACNTNATEWTDAADTIMNSIKLTASVAAPAA
ncbi:MAG: hypothetical protein ACI4N4_03245 [Candidatus Fimenecus sp.]